MERKDHKLWLSANDVTRAIAGSFRLGDPEPIDYTLALNESAGMKAYYEGGELASGEDLIVSTVH